jgi:hypothetical protein
MLIIRVKEKRFVELYESEKRRDREIPQQRENLLLHRS